MNRGQKSEDRGQEWSAHNVRSASHSLRAQRASSRLSSDTHVTVVGLGKTGLSSALFLARHGIPFVVVDSRQDPPGLPELRAQLPDAVVFAGGFTAEAFAGATHLLVSPGVSLGHPEIERARQSGAAMISDIDLFACMARAPIAAITGSNGKSTVTTLVGLMAQKAGLRVKVGGNLGTPVLDLLENGGSAEISVDSKTADGETAARSALRVQGTENRNQESEKASPFLFPVSRSLFPGGETAARSAPHNEPDCYVLELSSFQLERTSLLQPTAAVVLNVTPDHMDRYEDIEAYAQQKQRIFSGNGVMVLNADDPIVARMGVAGRNCLRYGLSGDRSLDYGVGIIAGDEWLMCGAEPVKRSRALPLAGRHNVSNALAALALGEAMGFPLEAMRQALSEFVGLDHRMQRVARLNGVTWINDSKATNIGACRAALEGIEGKSVLIAGGDAKGADISELRAIIVDKVRAAVLIGRDAVFFEHMLRGTVTTVKADTMLQAVKHAHSLARPGDTVLLSPACASLDQYADYQARGRAFVEAIRRLGDDDA